MEQRFWKEPIRGDFVVDPCPLDAPTPLVKSYRQHETDTVLVGHQNGEWFYPTHRMHRHIVDGEVVESSNAPLEYGEHKPLLVESEPMPKAREVSVVRKVDRPQDAYDRTTTYELSDGRYISLDTDVIRDIGLNEALRWAGIAQRKGRIDVIQRGKKVGTLPADFEPFAIRSTSFFYEPRGGDFVLEGGKWIAAKNLGPGDLEAVPGFVWDRS